MAALTEPMACAIRAAAHAGAGPNDSALVTGLGPIGLLTALVLKESGLRHVIATDLDADRRAIGEALGLTVIDPSATNLRQAVMDATDGRGVDAAIDAVGADATRTQCIESAQVGRQGRLRRPARRR